MTEYITFYYPKGRDNLLKITKLKAFSIQDIREFLYLHEYVVILTIRCDVAEKLLKAHMKQDIMAMNEILDKYVRYKPNIVRIRSAIIFDDNNSFRKAVEGAPNESI